MCAMTSLFHYVIWLLSISLSSCTDLAAVYRDRILILRDADSISQDSLSWEDIFLDLPRPLSYPVGLTQDAETNRLFVADTNPRERAKILSISLNSTFGVVNMTTAVKDTSFSVVEGMSYSPKSKHIYWTDATDHYIYKASLSNEDSSEAFTPKLIHGLGHTTSPRGLALDPCNEHLYWSEGGSLGVVASSVEMWNPYDNKHHIVEKDEEKDDLYQGITFDDISRTLVWAVTHGKEFNSTCRIVSTSVDEVHHQDLVHLENCHPFSLTVDEKYAYWADWGRQGIMRASRSDPNDVVRLLHTPRYKEDFKDYSGAYGIAKLNVGKVVQTPCQNKKEKSLVHEDNFKENGKDIAKIKEVPDNISDDVESTNLKVQGDQHTAAEDIKHRTAEAEHVESEVKDEKIKKHDENRKANAAPTKHSDTEDDENDKDDNIYRDRIVKNLNLKNMLIGSQRDSVEPVQKAKLESVESVTNVYNDKTQTGMLASSTIYEVPTTECVSSYNESYLVMTAGILAVICFVFLCSTIILAVILYRKRAVSCKGISAAALDTPQAVIVQGPRQVKRFGPKKKSFSSGNKSGLSGSSTCSGLVNDGVTINIEDCCQMTLCETPCYTTVKKQGKSYKDIRKDRKNYEDKKGLLDDNEDI